MCDVLSTFAMQPMRNDDHSVRDWSSFLQESQSEVSSEHSADGGLWGHSNTGSVIFESYEIG